MAWMTNTNRLTAFRLIFPSADAKYLAACNGVDAVCRAKCRKKLEDAMNWKTPKVTEIALGAEINSYACAEARK